MISGQAGGRIVLATWGFGLSAVRGGWEAMCEGAGALDAAERGCMGVELDSSVDSVGVGGMPDAGGRVTLDASVMVSPAMSGAVAGMSGYVHAVSVARRVMEKTKHKLLVGPGAEGFAQAQGFERGELLTDAARKKWEAWKVGTEKRRGHDTIGVLALDQGGMLAGACSTSGTAFKLPGRVGDSPIIGHGLYVDPKAGAAVATGRGELMAGVCATFLVVEKMRGGMACAEAIAFVLGRMRVAYALEEGDQCGIIALRADGAWGAGALKEGFKVAMRSGEEEGVKEVG